MTPGPGDRSGRRITAASASGHGTGVARTRPAGQGGRERGTPASCWLWPAASWNSAKPIRFQRRLRGGPVPLLKTLETTDLKKCRRWMRFRPRLCRVRLHHPGARTLCCWASTAPARPMPQRLPRRVHHGRGIGQHADRIREERQLKRYLAKLSRFELLVVDEVGYIPFSAEGAQLPVQVFRTVMRRAR